MLCSPECRACVITYLIASDVLCTHTEIYMASNVRNAFRITSGIEPDTERMLLNHINVEPDRCSFHSSKLPEKWNFSRRELCLLWTGRYMWQAMQHSYDELHCDGIHASGWTQDRPSAGGLEGNQPSPPQEQVSPWRPSVAPQGEKTSFSWHSSPAAETTSEGQAETAPLSPLEQTSDH